MNLNEDILICSFNYALGRPTYIVNIVAEEIVKNWDEIHHFNKWFIHKEINKAIENGKAGHNCDIEEWKKILKLPLK